MSRSIHQNKSRKYLCQRGYYDAEEWAEEFKKARIKRQVRSERKSPDLPFSPITAGQISYFVEDLPQFLFFPVTLNDVQCVLDDLPPGYLNGVSRLRLSSGHEYFRVPKSSSWDDLDQILNARFVEVFNKSQPGIFAPRVLGTYSLESGCIQLYAYALDPSVRLSRFLELCLKLKMLETLVHEVAHNHDKVQRVARGRWRMDSLVKAENYADKLSRILVDSVVVPYMRKTYVGSNS